MLTEVLDNPCLWPIIGPARDVSFNSSSEECFELAQDWLRECVANHQGCNPSQSTLLGIRLPTRLIHLGEKVEDLRIIATGDTEEHTNEVSLHKRYAALSHSWGKAQVITTTSQTLNQYKRCLPYTQLPQTFRDAITIARRLAIGLLWIDSLCIIQDSTLDWEEQADRKSVV